jgi:1-acyl-sn-glycerol-3-phosphate acyltransferase
MQDEGRSDVPRIRAFLVLLTFVVAALAIIPPQWLILRLNLPGKGQLPHRLSRFLLRLFNLRVQVTGEPVKGSGVLIAANHTSWLDMPVLSGLQQLSFVAKSEVATWPFFGIMAKLHRTVFVERQRRSKTGEQRDQLQARLLAGDAVVLFAEGTSSDGNRVLPFNSALLGAAQFKIEGGKDVPVQPVSIAYTKVQGIPMGREYRPFFAWYGDMDLLPHLWEAFVLGPIDVVVEYHPPLTIAACGGSRKALAAKAEELVARGVAHALAGLEGPSNRAQPARTPAADHEPVPDPSRLSLESIA